MKNLISICVCLLLVGMSNITAATPNSNPINKTTGDVEVKAKEDKSTQRAVISQIPGRTLAATVVNNNLTVSLTGEETQLDWILYQPKGTVISRLTTTSKIDQIKLDNLDAGKYMLMVKDEMGRVLYTSFNKA